METKGKVQKICGNCANRLKLEDGKLYCIASIKKNLEKKRTPQVQAHFKCSKGLFEL